MGSGSACMERTGTSRYCLMLGADRMTRALRLENIDEAARCVDPAFLNSPQVVDASMTGRSGRELILKLEPYSPVRSFKGRGTDFFMRGVATDTKVVCGSAG